MDEHRTEISQALLAACRDALERIESDFARKQIFGFVLAPNSGFASFALAVGLRGVDESPDSGGFSPEMLEKLKDHPDLLALSGGADANLTVASEWENWGSYSECFDEVYDLIMPLFEVFYESNVPEEIGDFFEQISTDVLLNLKKEDAFAAKVFEDDLLLGVQFADPDRADRVIRVSSKLNSDQWHGKVVEYFSQHLDSKPAKKKEAKKKPTKMKKK